MTCLNQNEKGLIVGPVCLSSWHREWFQRRGNYSCLCGNPAMWGFSWIQPTYRFLPERGSMDWERACKDTKKKTEPQESGGQSREYWMPQVYSSTFLSTPIKRGGVWQKTSCIRNKQDFLPLILQTFGNHTLDSISHYPALRVKSNHTLDQVCCYLDKTSTTKIKIFYRSHALDL